MRILLAGATGVVGRVLVPQLISAGHEVIAIVRSDGSAGAAAKLGAGTVQGDVMHAGEMADAVQSSRPDMIMHQLTALDRPFDARKFDEVFARTNELRTVALDNLVSAGLAAGVRSFLAQSFCGWPLERSGTWVKPETSPLDTAPPRRLRTSLAAIRHLEKTVLNAGFTTATVLRFGNLYGSGTYHAADGDTVKTVRAGKFPLIGEGLARWSFVHVEDAAAATVLAVDARASGLFNIVDDHPARVSDWLPFLARSLSAPSPPHYPAWLGGLFAGAHVVSLMNEARAGDNSKAKSELGWTPAHDWRSSFRELGAN